MLAERVYSQEYVDLCRSRVATQMVDFGRIAPDSTVRNEAQGEELERPNNDWTAFEITFYNNMVIVLDAFLVNRARVVEGKDGNPLNEVRVLAASMMSNGDVLAGDSTISLRPARSVLGYRVGDAIRVNEAEFRRLSEAYFVEIERRFVSA
jgi:hypothetical protein